MRQFFLCRYINNIQLLQALKRKNQLKVGPFFVDTINVKIIHEIDKCNIAVMIKAIQMSIFWKTMFSKMMWRLFFSFVSHELDLHLNYSSLQWTSCRFRMILIYSQATIRLNPSYGIIGSRNDILWWAGWLSLKEAYEGISKSFTNKTVNDKVYTGIEY